MVFPRAPHHPREDERLAALRLLDLGPSDSLDAITRIVARLLRVPNVLVSLVDEHEQIFASVAGDLEQSCSPRHGSFCTWVVHDDGYLEVADAWADPRFAESPLVVGPPYIRSYAGVPLRTKDGLPLGALCAFGPEPRGLTPDERDTLDVFACHVETHLESARRTERLERLERELRRRLDELMRLERSRRRVHAFIAHDLRNLAHVQRLAVETLLHGERGAESSSDVDRPTLLARLRSSSEQLGRLTDDLLDAACSTELGLDPRLEPLDAALLLRDVIEAASPLACRGDVRLELRAEALEGLEGDLGLLRRALFNVVENAVRHSPRGGEVRLEALAAGLGRWALLVDDEGPGLPEHLREQAFEAYVQGSEPGSTGLGLAFAVAVAEAHGGTLDIETSPTGGTRVRFELAATPLPDPSTSEPGPSRSTEPVAS